MKATCNLNKGEVWLQQTMPSSSLLLMKKLICQFDMYHFPQQIMHLFISIIVILYVQSLQLFLNLAKYGMQQNYTRIIIYIYIYPGAQGFCLQVPNDIPPDIINLNLILILQSFYLIMQHFAFLAESQTTASMPFTLDLTGFLEQIWIINKRFFLRLNRCLIYKL